MKKKTIRRSGSALVWTILLMLVMLGLIGLASDTGYGLLVAHQLQNAADASALAGAAMTRMGVDECRNAAAQCALANTAAGDPVQLDLNTSNAVDGDIVLGRYDRGDGAFTPNLEYINAVQVTAPRTDDSLNGPLATLFGRLFGVDTVNIERTAIAMNAGGTGSGLIALCGDCECAFDLNGTVTVHVNGGAVQVNSSDACAICGTGSFNVEAPDINVLGEMCPAGSAYEMSGNINSPMPPLPDPLEFLPAPEWDVANDLGAITGTGTYTGGYYSGGCTVTGGDVVLQPGIYIFDGPGLHIGGNTTFVADGVMCYVPAETGYIDIDGTGYIHISPPDPDLYSYPGVDTFEGVTLFQARDNTNDSRIIGTGLLDLSGTIYVPAARLEIGGEGEGFGNQLIAYMLWIHGTGDITINYEGNDPAPGAVVFLVK